MDEDILARNRSDFPTLAAKVLPQVIAKRRLTLVVTRQGTRWGLAKVPHVDVTWDVLALVRKMPPNPDALTGAQAVAAQRILSELEGLASAASLGGLSKEDYVARLTNVYVVYNANIGLLPRNLLQSQITQTMQRFLDARTVWDNCLVRIAYSDRVVEAEYDLKRQQIPEALMLQQVQLDLQEKAALDKGRQESFKPLFEVWSKAKQDITTARNLVPRQGGTPGNSVLPPVR